MAKKRNRHKKKAQDRSSTRDDGLKAFNNEDYRKAIWEWEQLPETFRPLSALAEAHFRVGVEEIAKPSPRSPIIQKHFEQAIEYQPNNLGYLYHLGLAKNRSGDINESIKIYRKIHAKKSAFSARASYSLALALFEKNALKKSLLEELDPKVAAIFSNIAEFNRRPYILPAEAPLLWHALISLNDGDFEQAKTMLKKVLSTKNLLMDKNLAHYYLGVIASHAKDWDTALKEWEEAYSGGLRAEKLETNLSEILHQEAEKLLLANNPKGALSVAIKTQKLKTNEDKTLNKLLVQIYQELGYQEAHNNQWRKALVHWKNALKLDGNSFRLAYNLALAYEKDGDYLSAAESWREVLRRRPRKPNHPDALNNEQIALLWQRTGEAYRNAGQPEEMIKVFKQAIKRDKDNYDLRMALSQEYLDDGRTKAAQKELTRILKRNKNYIPALLLMGEVVFNSENWWIRDSAPNYWEKILKQAPEHLQARQALGEYYRDQAAIDYSWSRLNEAIESYQKALEYLPNHPHTLAMIAGCYIEDDDLENAEDYINKALKLAPKEEDVYGEIVGAWIEVENYERAWAFTNQAEKALGQVPTRFYLAHAEHLLKNVENEEAYRWVDRAIENAPPDEPALIMASEMAMNHNSDFARHYLGKALKAKEREGEAYLLLGMLAHEEGEEKRRDKYWRQAERIARRRNDEELIERIEFTRFSAEGPIAMIKKIMDRGGPDAVEDFLNFMDGEF